MNNLVNYKDEDVYAIITIANGKANAISHEVINQLNDALDKAQAEKKVVILTGQQGILSAGYDLKVMKEGPNAAKTLVTAGSKLALKMLSFPLPIIAACNGHAVAKGAFLLLSCDYRIGVEGDYKIGLNEVMIGMTMHNAGITIARARLTPVYLERSVNNAEIYNPKGALIAGFLDKIVPEEHLIDTAVKTAKMFGQLHLESHAQTKLKVRKLYLESLEEAIAQDNNSEITIVNS